MCSISWQTHPQGYDLFFNRDEQRDRPTAEPPKLFRDSTGVAYLAPIDPQGGGTWIFLNSKGLVGALLNAYEIPPEEDPGPQKSRGRLLCSLAGASSIEDFGIRLEKQVKEHCFRPCYLFALSDNQSPGFWLCNGQALEPQTIPHLQFFTTSGFRPQEVCLGRLESFRKQVGEPPHRTGDLERFHKDEESRLTAFDIRMSRSDAHTVSYTRVRYRNNEGAMYYASRSGSEKFSPESETTLASDPPDTTQNRG